MYINAVRRRAAQFSMLVHQREDKFGRSDRRLPTYMESRLGGCFLVVEDMRSTECWSSSFSVWFLWTEYMVSVQFSSVQIRQVNVVLSASTSGPRNNNLYYTRSCRCKRKVFRSRRDEERDGARRQLYQLRQKK